MRLLILITAVTLCSSLYAQKSDTTLTEVLRNDSVHTPIELYKQDNIRYTVLINEVLRCRDIDSLNIIKDGLNDARNSLNETQIVELVSLLNDKDVELSKKEVKIKRNRRGFFACAALIVARLLLNLI
jgi:hypothetical protein